MEFDIDVSGMDILSKDYTICIASKDGNLIKGFKFNKNLIMVLSSRYSRGLYKYKKSTKGNITFKIRINYYLLFI